MKKVSAILAVALMATAANAATIGLRWAETAGQNLENVNGTIQVYLDNYAGDETVGGIIFKMQVSGDDPTLLVTGTSSSNSGWLADPATEPTLDNSQFAFYADLPLQDSLGTGSYVLGSISIHSTVADGSQSSIFAYIPHDVSGGLLSGSGSPIAWDNRYNDPNDASYTAGYVAFGNWGNPGWGTKTAMGHQPTANPLLITKVPEPTSLALIALGGFALLRRRN